MDQPEIEAVFVDALQNLAESVTELVGFEVAAVSVARPDDSLEVVAVAGSDSARDALVGHRTPISEVELELQSAEHWGDLRFVPHERINSAIEDLGWIPDIEASDDPEMWHPLDLLIAPFHDDDGRLRGIMAVDVPVDRRRPGPAQREQLQKYAKHARRALLSGLERAELAHRVRLADAARKIVREVSSELSTESLVETCQAAVCHGFDAVGMWLQTYEHDDATRDSVFGATQGEIVVDDEFKLLARAAAQLLWEAQEVVVVNGGHFEDIPGLEVDHAQKVRLGRFMSETLEADSMLFVPLGAGRECVGNMALTRRGEMPEWSVAEQRAALEIGHDLGRAMKNAQTFEQERILLEELRELEGYKSRLIATITHELRTPLTAVLGHLELIETAPLPPAAAGSLQAIERGAQRMRKMVEDLLVLSQVADPNRPAVAVPVDLGEVVVDVLELLETEIARKELRVVFEPPSEPVRALGDMMALDWMATNLVSNAVKYTPPGGTITITIAPTDDLAVLAVNDDGIGISEDDQKRLFEEFFRATDPAVLTVPGNGLGLSIAQRIVEQHQGTIEVDSTLGLGSTFTVRLPLSRGA